MCLVLVGVLIVLRMFGVSSDRRRTVRASWEQRRKVEIVKHARVDINNEKNAGRKDASAVSAASSRE